MNLYKHLLKWAILKLSAPLEQYQPLFGIETSDVVARRRCSDRMDAIESALAGVGLQLPGLDVLDIGSSFGYFSLYMADGGSDVDAFDVTKRLEWIVRLLARYNEIHRHINPYTNRIVNEEFESLERSGKLKSKYDVAILLSVLQHVCHEYGLEYSRNFLREIAKRTDYLIIELALSSEVHHCWSTRLPKNTEDFLEGIFRCGFELIGEGFDIGGPRDLKRPMYLCRNR